LKNNTNNPPKQAAGKRDALTGDTDKKLPESIVKETINHPKEVVNGA
jgi:hypothetical protein